MNDDTLGVPLLAMDYDALVLANINECLAAARAQMAPDLTDAERFAVELSIAAIAWHASRRQLFPLRTETVDPRAASPSSCRDFAP